MEIRKFIDYRGEDMLGGAVKISALGKEKSNRRNRMSFCRRRLSPHADFPSLALVGVQMISNC